MGLQQILGFYAQRGYGRTVGLGTRPALIVIDFSRAFTSGKTEFPGGRFGTELAATRQLIEAMRPDLPVMYTTLAYAPHMRDAGFWAVKVPWLVACQQDSPLVEIDPVLQPLASEPVIVKQYPSAFFGTDLHERLRRDQIDTLLIAGCTTSVCVRATALDAMQHGYRAILVKEAIGDFDPAIHALHLADVDARYGDVITLDAALTYLRRQRKVRATGGRPCPA
ncbi:MAG TPA: isochorismatase family protein [Rhodopila sp.]|jgi:nicotinamidase-related amidase|nr:isochorismatase family protein [Rhodopila sp.]